MADSNSDTGDPTAGAPEAATDLFGPQGGVDQTGSIDDALDAVAKQHPAVFNPAPKVPASKPPTRPVGWGQKLADFFHSAANVEEKTVSAVDRGAADFIDDTSDAVVGAGGTVVNAAIKGARAVTGNESLGSDWEKWYNSGDTKDINPIRIGEDRKDALFGKKQGGVYDFIENATSFTAAVETGSAAAEGTALYEGAAKGGKMLIKAGLIGLAQAATTDPRAARLSDMIENGPAELSNPLTRFLKSNGQDSEALARLKSGLEGSMTGYATDKFLGALGSVVQSIRGSGEAADAVDAASAAVASRKAVPDHVLVEPAEGGGYTLTKNVPNGNVEGVDIGDVRSDLERGLPQSGDPGISVHKTNVSGTDVTTFVHRGDDGAINGRLTVSGAGDGEVPSLNVLVDPAFRRQGIGTALYKAASDAGIDVETASSNGVLSDQGRAFQVGRRGKAQGGPDGLIFDSQADAESHAAGMNERINTQATPIGHVDDADVRDLMDAVKNAPAGSTPAEILPKGLFNYNYFGGDSAAQAAIETLSTKIQDAVAGLKENTASGLSRTADDVRAKLSGLLLDSDRTDWIGGAQSDADALREMNYRQMARMLITQQMSGKVADLARLVDVSGDNVLHFENLKAAAGQLMNLSAETAGYNSNLGRGLQQIQNFLPKIEGATSGSKISDVLQEFSKHDWQMLARQIRLSDGDPSLIRDALLNQAGEVATKADPTKWQMFNSFRVNMMLSGPKTSVVLAASQALASVQAPIEYWLGGLAKGNSELRQQGADMLGGMFSNAGAAWKGARKAWAIGEPVLDGHGGIAQDAGITGTTAGTETVNKGGILGWLSQFKVPTRVITTVDEFFKQFNYLNAVRGLSMRAAREDLSNMPKMSIEAESQFMAKRLADDLASSTNPTTGSAMNPVALSYARDATFQTPLTGFGKSLQQMAQDHPWIRLILPYIRTPVNLAGYAAQRTPGLGLLMPSMRADIAAGGDRAAVAVGKQLMGGAVWSSAAMFALNGNMTGAGPTDPDLKQQWLDAGYQPYSVRLPGSDNWISYRRIDQLGTPLSLVADMVEMSGHIHETDTANVFGKFAAALSQDLTSKTFLGGLANFMDAMHSGDPKAMNRFFMAEAGSLIPALARQVDPNDQYREVRGYIDALKDRVPGFSEKLESKRNILGEKVMKAPGYFNYAMNPFTIAPGSKIDHVQDELVKLGRGMAMPAEVVNGIDLTDRNQWRPNDPTKNQSPYDRMLELIAHPRDGGPNLRDQLTDLVDSPEWKDMSAGTEQNPGGERALEVSKIIKGAQKEAMDEMLEEYPDALRDQLEGTRSVKKEALEADPSQAPNVQAGQHPALFF